MNTLTVLPPISAGTGAYRAGLAAGGLVPNPVQGKQTSKTYVIVNNSTQFVINAYRMRQALSKLINPCFGKDHKGTGNSTRCLQVEDPLDKLRHSKTSSNTKHCDEHKGTHAIRPTPSS